jgi:hypothetical protein
MIRTAAVAVLQAVLAVAGCTLSGTAKAPVYVCAAQDSNGQRITCDVSEDSNPGDDCRCRTSATGSRTSDVYFGRVIAE